MIPFVGELAALGTAFAFSAASICFTLAGRKIDAITTSALSLPIAWGLIALIHYFTLGFPFPLNAASDRWFYLGTSGVLAFAIAAYFMLSAYQHIGPQRTMLIASFAPVLSAIMAWLFLGETLPANAAFGITLVIMGIVWVITGHGGTHAERGFNYRGVIFACLATVAQSTSFVFSSQGVAGDFPPLSAALMRTTAGVIALWIVIMAQQRAGTTLTLFRRDPQTALLLTGAAVAGPVIAGSLLLVAFQRVPVGIATTLSHTTAIILIPIGYLVFRDPITVRSVVGTVITIIGIGVLFT